MICNLVRVDQVVRGHAEASARHLLHRAAAQIAVRIALEARLVFAALAGVRHAANAVHRNGQRLVRFLADRTEAHRAGREALHDLLRRLNFFDRNRRIRVLQLHQSAQRAQMPALLIDQVGVLLERRRVVLPHRDAAAC